MDEFFQKYGWLVAAGVILAIVIVMMTPVGEAIKSEVLGFISDFASRIPAAGA